MSFSKIALTLSGVFNALIGLWISVLSLQPSPHLNLGSHARLEYLEYVFKAHGFLVAQMGLLQLFSAWVLSHPKAYAGAAFIVAIGDVYFIYNVFGVVSNPLFVPHELEPEFAWVSIYWALGELVVMASVLILNMRGQPKSKSN